MKYVIEDTTLQAVAESVRHKKKTTNNIKVSELADEILTIESGIDTSDATATADDIFLNKTAYAQGEKITGTFDYEKLEKISYDILGIPTGGIYTNKCEACSFSEKVNVPIGVPWFDLVLSSDTYHTRHYFVITENNGIYKMISYNMTIVYNDGYFYMSGKTINFNHHRAIDMWQYNSNTSSWDSLGYSWNAYTLAANETIVFSTVDVYTDATKTTILHTSNKYEY